MVTRDVVSETTLFFNGLDGYASESVIKEVIELLEYPEMPQDNDISIKDLLTACQRRPAQAPVTSATRAAGSLVGSEIADDAPESTQQNQQLLTPGPSEDSAPMISDGYRRRGKKAPQDVNLDPTDTSLIISGKRN
jgi:hypothetical protein